MERINRFFENRQRIWGVAIIAVFAFVYSMVQIVSYFLDEREMNRAMAEARRLYQPPASETATAANHLPRPVKTAIQVEKAIDRKDAELQKPLHWKNDPQNPLDIRDKFRELLKLNEDVVGWLRIEGSAIDYPVVQGGDNVFYLTHGLKKEKNVNGSIFMDYRNGPGTDKHLILYGHNMKNKTMFAELLHYESRWFFERHPVIEFSTLYEDTRWEIFSVHFTDIRHDYIRVDFENDSDFKTFVEDLKSRSLHPTDIRVDEKDMILTLSTCSAQRDDARFAVHARMITD